MNPKLLAALLAAALCVTAALPAAGAEVSSGDVYCFSGEDFAEEESFMGICITGLPDPDTGTMMLGTRVLRCGDILTASQLEQMTFHPLETEENQQATITYLPIYETHVEATTTMSVAVIGKQNQAPVAEDSAMETYRNLPGEAMLKVKDPEGEAMTFTVTRSPKRGEVVIREDGSFVYTPRKNKVGVDSFTYTAADSAGNVSREATVTVTVTKPSDATQYTDTEGSSCRFAAEWMKNTGIFVAENINGNGCFRPEKEVTQGEFLTMLVGALEIPLMEETSCGSWAEDAPAWLRPYLAAAVRSGLNAGLPATETFQPDAPITGAEAAVMIQNALDLTALSDTAEDPAIPAWAAESVSILGDYDISMDPGANLTRGDAAEVIYQISLLKDAAPGMAAIRAAQ